MARNFFAIKNRRLRSNWAFDKSLLVALAASSPSATAEPTEILPADALPQTFLEACDARVRPFGLFAPPVADAAAALIGIGAFSADEFRAVAIGFCNFSAVSGPVATTACRADAILLDEKYRAADQALVLRATLAHEMMHVLQHRALRAVHGAAYCDGSLYPADRGWMEAQADAFGDAVGELFVTGRPVAIANDCAAPVSAHVELNDPAPRPPGGASGLTVFAPGETRRLAARSRTSRALLYAETVTAEGPVAFWSGADAANLRFVDGRSYRLREAALAAGDRISGPFELRLVCDTGAARGHDAARRP